ncbi:UNVERIFIED_CONTAM: hypothetical protein FKN15_012711 [Acipenser sinensis]
MDVSVSVSFFQDELASTIEHAVKAAVDTVLCEITKVVGGKFTEFQMEMAGKEKENESLKLRLEISESELKAVRECMNAADADIKQPLRNMNPDCNDQDFQRIENQGLFQDPKESHAVLESEAQEWPRIEAAYTQEESFHQEWCASLKQVTELTFVKDEEVPRLECVPIKEEFIEQECVPIAEEVPTENNVCTLEENNQLGSSLRDDCPPECELGFREGKDCFSATKAGLRLGFFTSKPLEQGVNAGLLFASLQAGPQSNDHRRIGILLIHRTALFLQKSLARSECIQVDNLPPDLWGRCVTGTERLVLVGLAVHSRVSRKPASQEGGRVTMPKVIALKRYAMCQSWIGGDVTGLAIAGGVTRDITGDVMM